MMKSILGDSFSSRERPVLIGHTGAIAAANPLATAAGQELLISGGSVVDATIAAQAVLCIVAPDACGLGGDMLCLVRDPDGRTVAYNGSGAAARGRTKTKGAGATVTVPGIVDAWSTLHARYGRLPLDRVLEPAIRIAHLGMRVTPSLALAIENQRARLERNGAGAWPLLRKSVGDILVQDELAMLLARIAKEGAAAFYSDRCAEAIAMAVKASGGVLGVEDLSAHKTEIAEPIAVDLYGARLVVQPPVSQGILLAMSAKGLFALTDLPDELLDHASIELTEASFAFRDRAMQGALLLDAPLKLNLARASNRGGPRAYLHTAGVCAADRFGFCVSSLVSVFDDFGSGVYVSDGGFVLNNRAAGFTDAPNHAEPGKRPVHTLAPALLETSSGPLALSTPGADGQVQTLLQVLSGLLVEKLTLAGAIDRPRWRSENGRLLIERGHRCRDKLAALGHEVTVIPDGDMRAGSVTSAGVIGGAPISCADWRRNSWAGIV